jgi:IS30 family transposase
VAAIGRPGLSAAQKAELWKRWKSGESLSDIGRALERKAGSIHGVLRAYGGITPAQRQRSGLALTLHEREELSRGVAARLSLRQIAAKIGRSPSTVSREIARNGGGERYRAAQADERAWDRARRPKKCLLAVNRKLRSIVAGKLKMDWSPQQISGWLSATFPDDETLRVSPETIYRTLFVQARGALKKELIAHLRSGRMMRRAKVSSTKGQARGQIVDAVSIRERPADAEDRAVPGHWEGDLLSGARNTLLLRWLNGTHALRCWLKSPARTPVPSSLL